MSVKVMALVWDAHQQLKRPTATFVMLVLADHASDDGTGIWPSVDRLAPRTRLSTRHVQRTLRCLEGDGLIEKVREATVRRPREYRISLAALRGDTQSPQGRHPVTPG